MGKSYPQACRNSFKGSRFVLHGHAWLVRGCWSGHALGLPSGGPRIPGAGLLECLLVELAERVDQAGD